MAILICLTNTQYWLLTFSFGYLEEMTERLTSVEYESIGFGSFEVQTQFVCATVDRVTSGGEVISQVLSPLKHGFYCQLLCKYKEQRLKNSTITSWNGMYTNIHWCQIKQRYRTKSRLLWIQLQYLTTNKPVSSKGAKLSIVWFGLVLTIFNEGAYLTFKSIFHKALNLFQCDCEIRLESVGIVYYMNIL